MNQQHDPLLDLVNDDVKAADRGYLATLLKPYVSFEKDSKEIHFREAFLKLDSNLDKLEIVFLAEKARTLLFSKSENEGLSQADIIGFGIMPEGSVKSTLKKLSDTKRVLKNPAGKYYMPNYRMPELYERYIIKEESQK